MVTARPEFDRLEPVSDAYATLPMDAAFNWSDIADESVAGEWYLVVFRSRRRLGADEDRLTALDDLAHLEASGSAGFVHYFKGPANATGDCLSFCLWESRACAREASGKRAHAEAAAIVGEMYESYTLTFHRLVLALGSAAFSFQPYDRPAVAASGHVPAGVQGAAPA